MEWLQKINQMAHRGTHPRVMDLDAVQCQLNNRPPHENMRSIMQVKSTEFLCPYQAHCFALCMCCDFFACDCRMQCPEGCSCFHDSTWTANVIQCSARGHLDVPPLIPMDATSIYLDGNNFTGTLESQAFIGRKRVTSLFLNASMIGAINNQTFNGLTELEVLHLEDNLIHSLQGYEFGNLTSLRELYLQRNKLAYVVSDTFSSLVSLEVLYLHDNLLTFQAVWELPNLLPAIDMLTLSGNPWSCRCDFVGHFVMFTNQVSENLIIDKSGIQCQPKEDATGDANEDARYFLMDANSTCTDAMAITYNQRPWSHVLSITVCTIALCIVVAVASVIIFVFRTPLRVWMHSKYGIRICSSCSHCGSGSNPRSGSNRDKLYDAFVSYSPTDEDFVHQVLIGQLEQNTDEPGYKLCLQYRDLPHNSSISETYHSIASLCAKQVLVVSLAYMETEWPKIKYSIQDLRKWRPLIILIEELSSLDLAKSPEFNLLMKTAVVIRWSETGFWNKLKYYLPDAIKHYTYRRNINLNNSGTSVLVPSTPKLTDRLTGVYPRQQNTPVLPSGLTQQATIQSRQPQRGQHLWPYEGTSNNSSTSTRSTVTNGGSPRTLSSTEDSSKIAPAAPSLSLVPQNNTGGATMPLSSATPTTTTATPNVVTNPLEQLSSSIENGLEQWSDRSDSAYSWHDHTYQTIPTDPIYHTLEPDSNNTTTIPVMLPNGRMVPATLVRNSSGRLMPLVQVQSNNPNMVPNGAPNLAHGTQNMVPSTSSGTHGSTISSPLHSAARSGQNYQQQQQQQQMNSQVTFPKTIVYKSPSPRSGYLV